MIKKDDTHKKHRNILYGFVVILIVIQIVSFVVISSQVTKTNAKIEYGLEENKADLTKYFLEKLGEYNSIYQAKFNDFSSTITQQSEDISKEINLLKSSKNDFSGVVEDTVKGVVGIITEQSMGTGFIISDEGYVVTNYHVVSSGGPVNVVTNSNLVLTAEIAGFDSVRDIALLKVKSSDYEELKLGDSDNVQVGKKVVAIGNPLGLSFSVTEGIVSAVERKGPNGLEEYIQTDVSLNPGNSGGPLIDTSGEVIGMNNFKIGNTEGLGFALESNVIKNKVNEIVGKGLV